MIDTSEFCGCICTEERCKHCTISGQDLGFLFNMGRRFLRIAREFWRHDALHTYQKHRAARSTSDEEERGIEMSLKKQDIRIDKKMLAYASHEDDIDMGNA